MLKHIKRPFSSLFQRLPYTEVQSKAMVSLKNEFTNDNISFLNASKEEYFVQKTKSGIDIVLETPQVPSYVSMCLFFKVGIRNETQASSGYLNWLENSIRYKLQNNLKVLNNTLISFDRDCFVIKTACMGYQVEEFLDVISRCFKSEILNSDVLNHLEFSVEDNTQIEELLIQQAFGGSGYGKPKQGRKENFSDKVSFMVSARQLHEELTNPANFMLSVSGVYNRNDFMNIVEDKFAFLDNKPLVKASEQKEKSVYTGGEMVISNKKQKRQILNTEMDMEAEQFGLCFNIPPLGQKHFYEFLVLETLIGNADYFASGGPGKGMFARANNVLRRCGPATSVNFFKENLQDGGLFGITGKGISNSFPHLKYQLTNEVIDVFKGVNEEELERAKNILKSKLLISFERQYDRTEEVGRNFISFNGKVVISQYVPNIDKVGLKEVGEVLSGIAKTVPTIVNIESK